MSTVEGLGGADQPLLAALDQLIATLQTNPPGIWVNEPKDSIQIRLDGASNTWIWRNNRKNHLSYFLLGNTMCVSFYLDITSTLPTAQATMLLRIPSGFMMADRGGSGTPGTRHTQVPIYAEDGGASVTAYCIAAATHDAALLLGTVMPQYLTLQKSSGNWTAGTNLMTGQISFEITPVEGQTQLA